MPVFYSFNTVIELANSGGYVAELRGIAADQWIDALRLSDRSERLRQYLGDVSMWAEWRVLNPSWPSIKDVVLDKANNVLCTHHLSASIFYFVFEKRFGIIWMSGLFRHASEFEHTVARPRIH